MPLLNATQTCLPSAQSMIGRQNLPSHQNFDLNGSMTAGEQCVVLGWLKTSSELFPSRHVARRILTEVQDMLRKRQGPHHFDHNHDVVA